MKLYVVIILMVLALALVAMVDIAAMDLRKRLPKGGDYYMLRGMGIITKVLAVIVVALSVAVIW